MGLFRTSQAYRETHKEPQVAAATATSSFAIFTAPQKGRVLRVSITPDAAATGDNTNSKNLNLVNKGAAGAGTTEVGNLDLVTGVDLVAFDEKEIPLNATYANGVDMAEGDVLALQVEKVGTGVAVGPARVQVDWIPV